MPPALGHPPTCQASSEVLQPCLCLLPKTRCRLLASRKKVEAATPKADLKYQNSEACVLNDQNLTRSKLDCLYGGGGRYCSV